MMMMMMMSIPFLLIIIYGERLWDGSAKLILDDIRDNTVR